MHGGRERSEPQRFFYDFFLFGCQFFLRHLKGALDLNFGLVARVVVLQPVRDGRKGAVLNRSDELALRQVAHEHPSVANRLLHFFRKIRVIGFPAVEGLPRDASFLTGRLNDRCSAELFKKLVFQLFVLFEVHSFIALQQVSFSQRLRINAVYTGDFSMRKQRRFILWAAINVDPDPPNGSTIRSSRLVSTLMDGVRSASGWVPKRIPWPEDF